MSVVRREKSGEVKGAGRHLFILHLFKRKHTSLLNISWLPLTLQPLTRAWKELALTLTCAFYCGL